MKVAEWGTPKKYLKKIKINKRCSFHGFDHRPQCSFGFVDVIRVKPNITFRLINVYTGKCNLIIEFLILFLL
jgi:hypothetical protein